MDRLNAALMDRLHAGFIVMVSLLAVTALTVGGCGTARHSVVRAVRPAAEEVESSAPDEPMETVALASADGLPGESYPAITSDGAWCWFGDPRAVTTEREHSRTFVGYITSAGDAVVTQYDHDTGELAHALVKRELQRDDHANPSLLVRSDGRLMVFYCGHRGRWMVYRTSTLPDPWK